MTTAYTLPTLLKEKNKLKSLLKDIPAEPGCYLMKDSEERLLYVGKSKNLQARVRSYFNSNRDHSPRILLMIRQVFKIEIILTDNESESLTLESNLIKANKPYFNILLKDDKKYPYVCISWSEEYPRIYITRRRRDRHTGDRYYGPYVDVNLLRQTLFSIKRIFPLRQRPVPLYKDKTCLNYSIERCPGVCQKKISPSDYKKTIKRIEMILQGRNDELKLLLIDHMNYLSDHEKYEKALLIRNQIKGIEKLYESQKMIIPDSSICRDIIALVKDKNIASIQIFQMRAGKLIGRLGYISSDTNVSEEIILQQIIEKHYTNVDPIEIPSEILIQDKLTNIKSISEWLSELKNQKVKVIVPKKSKKAELIRLVERNAKYELENIKLGKEREIQALDDLCELLHLNEQPKRIEAYDISHMAGSDAVGSQVVFINGTPAKQHYRKYLIKNKDIVVGHSDDYESLSEVIKRRFSRWSKIKSEYGNLNNVLSTKKSIFQTELIRDWPDLIVIDGGKGQLNAVVKTLIELDLNSDINVISLAKKNEEVFIPGLNKAIDSEKDQPALQLLRRLRDEAHRFAISFHRNRRSKRMTRSQLTEIPSVGPKRIRSLLSHFQSVEAIQLASIEDLSMVNGLGKNSAQIIWKYFHP